MTAQEQSETFDTAAFKEANAVGGVQRPRAGAGGPT
jgi:hypothetical protein